MDLEGGNVECHAIAMVRQWSVGQGDVELISGLFLVGFSWNEAASPSPSFIFYFLFFNENKRHSRLHTAICSYN
jgi:hypothetical protein